MAVQAGPPLMQRRSFLSGGLALAAAARFATAERAAASYRFGVFALFEPQTLLVSSPEAWTLQTERGSQAVPPARVVTVHREDTAVRVQCSGEEWNGNAVEARPSALAGVLLEVPVSAAHGGIRRRFFGEMTVRHDGHVLTPVVTLSEAIALASIVAAESAPQATATYLEAQAIVSRSFLQAGRPGHAGYDFCDTTHCQFLREAPPPHSHLALAVARTAGLRLRYADQTFAALYSRRCGGTTRTSREAGVAAAGGYPYHAVACAWCRTQPGAREGHGVGLCQFGAAAMARAGHAADAILRHYYPGAWVG